MTNTTHPQAVPIDVDRLKLALAHLHEEHEKMLALACALMTRLEPENLDDPEDGADLHSWRLSQILHDRLSSTAFLNHMQKLVIGA